MVLFTPSFKTTEMFICEIKNQCDNKCKYMWLKNEASIKSGGKKNCSSLNDH